MSNKDESNNEEQQDQQPKEEIKAFMYKENDINTILQLLQNSRPEFDNFELFAMLKQVLFHPIKF